MRWLDEKKGNVLIIFNPENHMKSAEHNRTYAFHELAYVIIDFSAAVLCVVGSFLFFRKTTTYYGAWLFLIGSVLFGVRPTIKLSREAAYLRLGDYDQFLIG